MKPDTCLTDELLEAMLRDVQPVSPPPERAERMRARLAERARQDEAADQAARVFTVQAGASEGWQEVLPKIHAKRIYTNGYAESYLVRLEPGCCAPPHDHPEDEECVVLSGELTIGDIRLKAGDLHVAHGGSSHGATMTDTGALVYLRYSAPLSRYMPL